MTERVSVNLHEETGDVALASARRSLEAPNDGTANTLLFVPQSVNDLVRTSRRRVLAGCGGGGD